MTRAKLRNKRKIKNSTAIAIFFLLVCFFCFFFLKKVNTLITPKLVEIATRNIEKLTYNIFNDYTILTEIKEEEYKDLLNIQKNNKNEIINVSYNTKKAYEIVNKVVKHIKDNYQSIESGDKPIDYYDEELSELEDGLILTMPIGLASNQIYFSNLGPKIPIKVKFIGTILTNLKTRVKNYGINNVLMEVYIDVSITHEITSPVTFENKKINYEILIGAEVVQGEVPSYYGGLFENKSNILNIPLE